MFARLFFQEKPRVITDMQGNIMFHYIFPSTSVFKKDKLIRVVDTRLGKLVCLFKIHRVHLWFIVNLY